jgi:23S rRNA (pseudouridine1915-N3)-methyltransferase
MHMTIAAIGRLRAGPEREVIARYLDRIDKGGRRLGLTLSVKELNEGRASTAPERKKEEAGAILAAAPGDALLVALDERGTALTSRAFAERLSAWRDGGTDELVFAIGGADGLDETVLQRARLRLAFGSMTWPHQLARLMLAEQLYRAITIASGHPYHRD